jgi:hypothetical protein
VAGRVGTIGLLTCFQVDSALRGALPNELDFLTHTMFTSLFDASPIVANHAAHALVDFATQATSAADVRRVSGALRKIAKDPRLGVRGAEAYGAPKLRTLAMAEEVRRIAEEIDAAIAAEDYAFLACQRQFGELEARYPRS